MATSEPFSAEAAFWSSQFSSIPEIVIISVTSGLTSVIVPVLSKTIVLILWVVSKASPPLVSCLNLHFF